MRASFKRLGLAARVSLVVWLLPIGVWAQKSPETIYQLLNQDPNGCRFSRQHPYNPYEGWEDGDVARVGGPPGEFPEITTASSLADVMQQAQPRFLQPSRYAGKFPETKAFLDTLSNGNMLYRENNLYGLKKPDGTVIIPPSFRHVVPHEGKGFAGYKDATCNYYDAQGAKLLATDYYTVVPTTAGTFIVQTNTGFGVVTPAGKPLIKPSFYQIEPHEGKGQFYYKVYTHPDKTFFLSKDTKDTVWLVDPYHKSEIVSATHWAFYGSLFDIKKKKEMVCGPGGISVVDEAHQLAVVHRGNYYLVHFSGKLVTATAFQRIDNFNEHGLAVASIGKDNPSGRRSDYFGVIDRQGRWVVEPKYTDLNSKVPGFLALGYEGKTDLFRAEDGKKLYSDLPYTLINEGYSCENKYYLGLAPPKQGYALLNDKFEVVSPGPYAGVLCYPKKNFFVMITRYSTGGLAYRLMDGNNQRKVFEWEGRSVDTFDHFRVVDDHLAYGRVDAKATLFLFADESVAPGDQGWNDIKRANHRDLYLARDVRGVYGLINAEGKTVVPPIFDKLSAFSPETGLARYAYKGTAGYITTDGTLLFGTQYADAQWLFADLFKVRQDNQWGVVTRDNKVIVPMGYEEISLLGGLLIASRGGVEERFTLSGKEVKP